MLNSDITITSTAEISSQDIIPAYLKDTYNWAYVDKENVDKLDHNFVVRTLLFMQDQRLMRAYLNKIQSGMKVWQVAHVYGDLVRKAALRCGKNGTFHLTDVLPVQIEHAKTKLNDLAQAKIFHADASKFKSPESNYDLVCSFFLLHEVPEEWKYAIVENMFRHLSDDGEMVFVDYHKPKWWQPIGYILRLVNHYLEPFAKTLWNKEIQEYATNPAQYTWKKSTIFGGVYQIVSVKKKLGA